MNSWLMSTTLQLLNREERRDFLVNQKSISELRFVWVLTMSIVHNTFDNPILANFKVRFYSKFR
jgi:hypothetical protein